MDKEGHFPVGAPYVGETRGARGSVLGREERAVALEGRVEYRLWERLHTVGGMVLVGGGKSRGTEGVAGDRALVGDGKGKHAPRCPRACGKMPTGCG